MLPPRVVALSARWSVWDGFRYVISGLEFIRGSFSFASVYFQRRSIFCGPSSVEKWEQRHGI